MSVGPEWNSPGNCAESQKSAFDAWALCLRRKWLILFVLVVAVGFGYLYYTKSTKIYEATAQVLIIEKRRDTDMPLKGGNGRVGFEDSISTHMLIIKSPEIVKRALKSRRIQEQCVSMKNLKEHELIGHILQNLEVLRAGGKDAPDAKVLQLVFRCTDSTDCKTVLEELYRAYQEFLGEKYQNVSQQLTDIFTRARDEYLTSWQIKQKALAEFMQTTEDLPAEGQPSDAELTKKTLQAQLDSIQSQVDVLRNRLLILDEAMRSGKSREQLVMWLKKLSDADQATEREVWTTLDEKVFPLIMQLELLRQQYGPEYPAVKAAQQQLQITLQMIENKRISLGGSGSGDATFGQMDLLSQIKGALQLELAELEKNAKSLQTRIEMASEKAQKLQGFIAKADTMRKDAANDQNLFNAVVETLRQMNILQDSSGFDNQLLAEPGLGYQVEPNIFKVMAVAGFCGLLFGFGLAYLVDMADKSFRSPEEVRQELGVPILGHIPVIVPDSSRRKRSIKENSKIQQIVCTFHRPKSTTAEAYRAVRTALHFGTRGEGHKVIQITSPDPGDGKTTLVCNLAVCVAQSGKRVLLIDADFRRPRVHRVFGVDEGCGLSGVIEGVGEMPDAIRETEMPNLWVLPCGSRPTHPSELLSSPRFKELIDVVRDQFDIVIIDTPPVLAVTDPCVVAPRVDGVLLLLRITKHVRPHSKRAVEILESLGANMLGLVINGVGGSRPGLGYGFSQQYGYRYAYASGYYDGYSYGESRYGHYYSEDDEEEGGEEGKSSRREGRAANSNVNGSPSGAAHAASTELAADADDD